MKRFTVLPVTLFRIQPKLPVELRDHATQMAKQRTSFDLKTYTEKKLIRPMEGDKFHTPNGLSLRPKGQTMAQILTEFRGSPTIFCIQAGTPLPERCVLLHEHTDHYSLQVAEEMPLDEFNTILNEYLKKHPIITKKAWLEAWNDPDDQDN